MATNSAEGIQLSGEDGIFDGASFLDVPALIKMKEDLGVTISLVIPTLEEEDNIGRTLSIVNEKVGRVLLDEVIVIDGGSRDRTVDIARASGVTCIEANQVLSEFNRFRGKGVQLWKSLQVTKSDLILYCDADISNFSEIFILGLIGPLLAKPTYRYCKAFYKRALRINGDVQEGGGGRVTEICARPIFSLYYPELRHIIQPLGGEYAGWRKDLERVAYTSGYGVETKLLLQFARIFGAGAICQVNLHEKEHRHQSLAALSKMSFVIMQTFMRDMADRYDTPLMVQRMHHTLWIQKQAASNNAQSKERSSEHEHCNSSGRQVPGCVGNFLQECEVSDTHLPPIVGLPSYVISQYQGFTKVSVLLCRHGQTHHHVDKRIMGWCNSTLTAEGLWQAEDLGRRLKRIGPKLGKVISSDLTRSIQTATAIVTASDNSDVKLLTDETLREQGKGVFENRTKEDILLDPDFNDEWDWKKLADPHSTPPNGEDSATFRARLVKFLKTLAVTSKEPSLDGHTLLVTHHTVVWELYRYFFGVERGLDLAAESPETSVGPILAECEMVGKLSLWRLDFMVKAQGISRDTLAAKRQRIGMEIDMDTVILDGMQMTRV
jgi:glucosyl-3-phosphoglycerate synthase|eukprot:TRINITY_DN67251_c0_g1_i1.p1 TRINITY_DN67251_c0_g1~~TRINITY_DN67251_c0_g1_i1.p1  ORF type:complete len:606 (+),score=112.86 TRINITY_DN67251_c0_g1_i1:72-1889(+)